MQKREYAGRCKVGRFEVAYDKDLEHCGKCVGQQLDEFFSFIRKEMDFEEVPFCKQINVFVIHCKDPWRRDAIPKAIFVERRGQNIGLLLLVLDIKDTPEQIVGYNVFYPTIFMHELTEGSLVHGPNPITTMDTPMESLFRIRTQYQTRWFREGFSTYVGLKVLQKVWSTMDAGKSHTTTAVIQNVMHQFPFSHLAEAKTRLLSWSSYTAGSFNYTENRYYEASLGLFLLIERRYGQEAICQIVQILVQTRNVTGPALVTICNKVLKKDIQTILKEFTFPDLGLTMDSIFPGQGLAKEEGLLVKEVAKGSVAEKGNIHPGDILLQMGDKPLKNNLGYELEIFNLMEKKAPNAKIVFVKREQQNRCG